MNNWKLIETAPTDETAILGYQKITNEVWMIAPMYFKDGHWLIFEHFTFNTEYDVSPTHWMKIPDPPIENNY